MDDRLTAWLERVGLELVMFDQLEEPGRFEADYSGRYLAELEELLFSEVDYLGDPHDLSEPSLARAIAGYFGETLLRLAGGSWQWQDDEPAVQADEALGLPPMFPLRLMAQVSDGEADGVFVRTYARWEQAVAAYQQAHPGWKPTKQYSPGIDPVPMTTDEATYLDSWLAERERAFPAWGAEHAADGPWDFTVESLDRLEALLHRLNPTVAHFKDPANAPLVDGATWYLGETLRRIRGGTWFYHEPDPTNVYAGHPSVQPASQPGSRGDGAVHHVAGHGEDR